MKRCDYDSIIRDAENGDPIKMLELAKLYKAGAFGNIDYGEYVFWLKRFFEAPKVNALVMELDDKYDYGGNHDNTSVISYWSIDSISIEEYWVLRNAIIEAGLALGIFYSRSSKKEELKLSSLSLTAALDASGWDFLTYSKTNGTKESIVTLLGKVNTRINKLENRAGEDNE